MEKYYTVVTAKDNFICQILDDEKIIRTDKDENEMGYIVSVDSDFITLTNIYMLINGNDGQPAILSFEKLPYGSKHITLHISQIQGIYFIKEELEKTVRSLKSGIIVKQIINKL